LRRHRLDRVGEARPHPQAGERGQRALEHPGVDRHRQGERQGGGGQGEAAPELAQRQQDGGQAGRRHRQGDPGKSVAVEDRQGHRPGGEDRADQPPKGADPLRPKPFELAVSLLAHREQGGGDQQAERRIDRQRIVRQLGRHDLEDQPGRHRPGKAEAHPRLGAFLDRADQRRNQEQRSRPQGGQRQNRVQAGEAAVRLLPADQLGQQILLHRLGDEAGLRPHRHRRRPGQHHRQGDRQAGGGAHRRQPAPAAVGDDEGEDGEDHHHRRDRPLDQHA
jgi:hypothetical protein